MENRSLDYGLGIAELHTKASPKNATDSKRSKTIQQYMKTLQSALLLHWEQTDAQFHPKS
jgi:hypothetical protein